MKDIVRKVKIPENKKIALAREWITANGLGGYASGTISGTPTRRYHGALTAALPYPMGRAVMISHLAETIIIKNKKYLLSTFLTEENKSAEKIPDYIKEFRLENGLPCWKFQIGNVTLEKKLHLVYLQNTVHITYTLLKGSPEVELELEAFVNFRFHKDEVSVNNNLSYSISIESKTYEIHKKDDPRFPPLRIKSSGGEFSFSDEEKLVEKVFYCEEHQRGYPDLGSLYSPGKFSLKIQKGKSVTLIASTESWHVISALNSEEAEKLEQARRKKLLELADSKLRHKIASELVLAADQFVVRLPERVADAAMIRAAGEHTGTVIAGYYWFTDWGRDTMISLEGLTLLTGRFTEAQRILNAFSFYINKGLIPNLFPEGSKQGLYNTADASLWYFHAVHKYVEYSHNELLLKELLPKLVGIAESYIHGTLFNIKADEKDGLVKEGEKDMHLTWMDAKVGDWVVTPRRGKTVEINALWYNALCLLSVWLEKYGSKDKSSYYKEFSQKVYKSFNARFWNPEKNCLFDIVDGENGNDSSLRPNQIFSISLPYPVLKREMWESVVKVVKKELLTPLGLRSLSRNDPEYKNKYFGDRRSRDAAYHQGTVWPWLLGPFTEAWIKTFPGEKSSAREFLQKVDSHLSDACIGSVSEITDAEFPYIPRGCPSQAWSVAEILRCFSLTS